MGKKHDRILMGVMGDSISAGTLADFPLRGCVRDIDGACAVQGAEESTRFFFENKRHLSWASGESIHSHFHLLTEFLKAHGEPREVKVLNVAKPGAKVEDLARQADKIRNAMDGGHYSELGYLTINIGSNDACSGPLTPLEDMRTGLLRALRVISYVDQEKIRVLLVGLPRIPDVGAPEIQKLRTAYFGLKCKTLQQKILKECPNLLSWKTPEEYQARISIVEERNRLLKETVAEAGRWFPNLDMVYTNRMYELPIKPSLIAIDCFHPSAKGQQFIAEELWLDQPWFK